MKISPYKVDSVKNWFNSAFNEVQTNFLPIIRSQSFKFWLHIKNVVNIHIEIPALDKWLGDKMNEQDKRMFRLFGFWLFCYISVRLLVSLITLIF